MIRIGTAGWTIPKVCAPDFPTVGRHLERYARVMDGVEINSSFHRPHRARTYVRWAGETPDRFRFSVKLPRIITHDARLVDAAASLDGFLGEVAGLGDKLGVLLVQLPPSLTFSSAAEDFFALLRERHRGPVACEPRHASWFTGDADQLLVEKHIARVAADPALSAKAAEPGGWSDGLVYYRWHGSPRKYWSAYDDGWLADRAESMSRCSSGAECWCVFDNTAAGAALSDALRLKILMEPRWVRP